MLKLSRIIDGDSLKAANLASKQIVDIRLAFIDAPEYTQEIVGKSSREKLVDLFNKNGDEFEIIDHGTDRYDRTVAEVIFPESRINCNLAMVAAGYAFTYDYYLNQAFDQGRIDENRFNDYQSFLDAAKKAREGIWAVDNIQNPAVYRKMQILIEQKKEKIQRK